MILEQKTAINLILEHPQLDEVSFGILLMVINETSLVL